MAENIATYLSHWTWLNRLLIVWLLFTCLFSWHVATGVSLVGRVSTLHESLRQGALLADTATSGKGNGAGATSVAGADKSAGAPRPAQAPAATAATNMTASASPTPSPAAPAAPGAQPTSVATPAPRATATSPAASGVKDPGKAEARDDVSSKQSLREAEQNLGDWMDGRGFVSATLDWLLGLSNEQPYADPVANLSVATSDAGDRDENLYDASADAAPGARLDPNVEWAAVYVGLLSGKVLPVLYGVLGAWAAVVRDVSRKMRDSRLAPRDLSLAWAQLGLGAVIAGCIGLFVSNTSGDPGDPAIVHMPSTLSVSALCFVAGFGVDGVFQALEGFMRRLFNLEPVSANGKAG